MSEETDNGSISIETKIRYLRLQVDRFINSTSVLNPSREVSLCHTSLERAKCWLGEVLKELGTENPYKTSTDATSPVIEPQAEHNFETIYLVSDEAIEVTQTAHVKFFRKKIDEYLEIFDKFYQTNTEKFTGINNQPTWGRVFLVASKMNMIEAKHWLGWELDRIRKEKEYQEAVKNGSISTSTGRLPLPL